jgi:hypothetical protein
LPLQKRNKKFSNFISVKRQYKTSKKGNKPMKKETREKVSDNLVEILSYRRPHNSRSEQDCIKTHLDTLPGVRRDAVGNRYTVIGANPRVAFLSHTDSVHILSGRQRVKTARGVIGLVDPHLSDCLGGDDGVGVWIMIELVKRQVPGLYVWHRGEEVGCLGSRAWVASQLGRALMIGIEQVVCLDRRGYQDVIVALGEYYSIASEHYARWLCHALRAQGLFYAPYTGGLMADVQSWAPHVPECVNLSVGYHHPHHNLEYVDAWFAQRLVEALAVIPWGSAPIARDPEEEEFLLRQQCATKKEYRSWRKR